MCNIHMLLSVASHLPYAICITYVIMRIFARCSTYLMRKEMQCLKGEKWINSQVMCFNYIGTNMGKIRNIYVLNYYTV